MNRISARYFKYVLFVIAALITITAYAVGGSYFFSQISQTHAAKNNLIGNERMNNLSRDMIKDYDIVFQNTTKLAKFVQNNPNTDNTTIENFISRVLMPRDLTAFFNRKNTDFINAYVVAPDDIISLVYSNQKITSNDISIFTSDDTGYYSRLAKTNPDSVIVQGPIIVPNTHEVLIYNRQAIFVNGKYWGYVAICADFHKYLECIRLNASDDNFVYALRSSVYRGTNDFIWGDSSLFEKKNKLSRHKSLFFGKQRWDIAIKVRTEDLEMLNLYCILFCAAAAVITYFFIVVLINKIFKLKASESIDQITKSLLHKPFLQLLTNVLKGKEEHCLVIIEIMNFKQINSIYGYDTGDDMLKLVSARLKSVVAYNDRLCRIGGEFMLLLRNIRSTVDVDRTVSEIHDTLSKTLHVNNYAIKLNVLIGAANTIEKGRDVKALVQSANISLDEEKISLLSSSDKSDPVNLEAQSML